MVTKVEPVRITFTNKQFAGKFIIAHAKVGVFGLFKKYQVEKLDILGKEEDELNPSLKEVTSSLSDALYEKLDNEFLSDINKDDFVWLFFTDESVQDDLTGLDQIAFAEDLA